LSVVEVNATKVFGAGIVNTVFDLSGVTYKRGPNLGDKQIVALGGRLNVLKNFRLDDSGLSGVSGVAALGGVDNVVEDAYLDNCVRYGFIFGYGALRNTFRRITIRKCQHGISGSSGSTGEWNTARIQTDCVIENCDISGMQIDGIKLKQMVRTIVRNNKIDVYPFYPEISSKSGIYFAGTDTASKDCIVENNTIFQSAPTPSGIATSRAVITNPDQLAVPTVVSTGNVVRNNIFSDMSTGVWIRGSNGRFENNQMIKVPNNYTTSTLSGYPAPTNNVIITSRVVAKFTV